MPRWLFYFVVAFLFLGLPLASANPLINEIMASNQTTLASPTGALSDWVELLNSGSQEINLAGYYVSDRPDLPKKWQIPSSLIIPAGGHLLLWCDGQAEAGPAHLPFSLSANGESFI